MHPNPNPKFILEDHLIFNENAQFFNKKKKIPKRVINELFTNVSKKKSGRSNFKKVRELHQFDDNSLFWSLIIFKREQSVSFLDKPINGWEEDKFSYLLIVEFENFCIIIKRNISSLASFQSQYLLSIDYQVLSKLEITPFSEFRALAMQNIDPSEYSTRAKSIRSNDLKKSMSPFGIHRYILKGMSVASGHTVSTLTFNTSRINKPGEKLYLPTLFAGLIKTVKKIKNFTNETAYVDSFAKPLKYEDYTRALQPLGILLLLGELEEAIEIGRFRKVVIQIDEDNERLITPQALLRYLRKYNVLLPIGDCNKTINDVPRLYEIDNAFDDDACISINEKSISLRSPILQKVRLHYSDGDERSLLSWFREKNLFLVNFNEPDLVYFSGKLFKDSRLLGAIEGIEDVFMTHDKLKDVTSEKGKVTSNCVDFPDKSIFHFIEKELVDDQTEYLFCDDLGDEWADFIEVKSDRICLYHAKYKKKVGLSASNLQDVIGQAQKNLGNVIPDAARLANKKNSWQKNFKLDSHQTKIAKMRKGDTVDNGLKVYQQKLNSSKVHFEISLVINYLSKEQIMRNFRALRDGGKVEKKAQVIQLLWFISSFVHGCKEMGIKPFIICQP